jgi:hypothetical protein
MRETGTTCIGCGVTFARGDEHALYRGNYCVECRGG